MALHHGQPASRLRARDRPKSCHLPPLACAIAPGASMGRQTERKAWHDRVFVDAPIVPGQQTAREGGFIRFGGPCRRQSPREPVAREGLKMIKIQSRCRGAARKSRRVLGGRVATRHPHIPITSGGRGLICIASIGRAPGGHASTCSRGSCAGPAVCATPAAPVWNSTFLGELSSKIILDNFLRNSFAGAVS